MPHIPVLLNEVITGLDIKRGNVFLDGTLGGGGHSEAVAKSAGGEATIIGLDEDGEALKRAEKKLADSGAKIFLKKTNFRNLDKALAECGFGKADKILLDLGWSSDQIENSGRGFSFNRDEPLLMTFNDRPEENALTAGEIVNSWQKENIAEIIRSYGDEPFAEKIAGGIVEARKKKPIKTTGDLKKIIGETIRKRGKLDPATKTFQALRIAVNDEISALREGLEKGVEALKPGGRMAIISFHSLEDRIVKFFFKQKAENNQVIIITKKPIRPKREEILANRRSRSAKLRIIEKK